MAAEVKLAPVRRRLDLVKRPLRSLVSARRIPVRRFNRPISPGFPHASGRLERLNVDPYRYRYLTVFLPMISFPRLLLVPQRQPQLTEAGPFLTFWPDFRYSIFTVHRLGRYLRGSSNSIDSGFIAMKGRGLRWWCAVHSIDRYRSVGVPVSSGGPNSLQLASGSVTSGLVISVW